MSSERHCDSQAWKAHRPRYTSERGTDLALGRRGLNVSIGRTERHAWDDTQHALPPLKRIWQLRLLVGCRVGGYREKRRQSHPRANDAWSLRQTLATAMGDTGDRNGGRTSPRLFLRDEERELVEHLTNESHPML
eukprot:5050922-Amphidinium_carterae.1